VSVIDEEQHEDEDHDARHKGESGQGPEGRINIRDANGTENSSETGASCQNAHPSALFNYFKLENK
jgi:hypothetical protein